MFDTTISFLTGIPEKTEYSGSNRYMDVLDLFLWGASMVFFTLGYLWASKGTCVRPLYLA